MMGLKAKLVGQIETASMDKVAAMARGTGTANETIDDTMVAAEWLAFVTELRSADYDDAGPRYQGGANSITRLIGVYADDGVVWVFGQWEMTRAAERAKARRAAEAAATVEIQSWLGEKFAKPKRIPKEQAAWSRKGHVLVTEALSVEGRDFDSQRAQASGPIFSIRTAAIGSERANGTIAAKRLIVFDGKRQVQYLVKPRSADAERKYRARLRLAEIESRLKVNAEYMTADEAAALRTEADCLRGEVAS